MERLKYPIFWECRPFSHWWLYISLPIKMNGSRVFRLKENPRVLLIQGYENHNSIQRLRSEEYHLENNYCLASRSCSIKRFVIANNIGMWSNADNNFRKSGIAALWITEVIFIFVLVTLFMSLIYDRSFSFTRRFGFCPKRRQKKPLTILGKRYSYRKFFLQKVLASFNLCLWT